MFILSENDHFKNYALINYFEVYKIFQNVIPDVTTTYGSI